MYDDRNTFVIPIDLEVKYVRVNKRNVLFQCIKVLMYSYREPCFPISISCKHIGVIIIPVVIGYYSYLL